MFRSINMNSLSAPPGARGVHPNVSRRTGELGQVDESFGRREGADQRNHPRFSMFSPLGLQTLASSTNPLRVLTRSLGTMSSEPFAQRLSSVDPKVMSEYHSPYKKECPAEFVVVCNRSPDARAEGIRDLRAVWPSLKVIELRPKGQTPSIEHNVQSVELDKPREFDLMWESQERFNQKHNPWISRMPHEFKAALKSGKVAWEGMWSSTIENPGVIEKILGLGFVSCSPSPETLRRLGEKSNFVKTCQEKGVPMTPKYNFVQDLLDRNNDATDEDCLHYAAFETKKILDQGMILYAKHKEGGGGEVAVN